MTSSRPRAAWGCAGKLFRTVELPLAMPVILSGVRLALVQVWATATIAALVAGPGLGFIITRGFLNHRTEEVVAGAILVAVGALLFEGLAVLGEQYFDPMRAARRQPGKRGMYRQPRRSSELFRTEPSRGMSVARFMFLAGCPPGAHRTRAVALRGTQKVVHLMRLKQCPRMSAAAALLLATGGLWRQLTRGVRLQRRRRGNADKGSSSSAGRTSPR